ncbi:putative chaperone protein ClpB1-like [Capsicum annuum]|nr:putative chaperone protein ClpB1-like [Capsicum annuum]
MISSSILNSITEPSSPTEPGPVRTGTGTAGSDHFISRFTSSATDCHGFWHDAALVLPTALFVVYLGFHGRSNVKKLTQRRSYVMIGYYGFLWFAALLNLAWCFLQMLLNLSKAILWKLTLLVLPEPLRRAEGEELLFVNNNLYVLLFLGSVIASSIQIVAKQVWQCTPGKQVAWNLLSLFGTSAMLFLEISIVAFLLQENYASCLETLTHTFMVSGLFVGADLLLKVIFIFGFGVPLFLDGEIADRGKWGVWFINKLLLTAAYGYILFVHFSKWRDKLPPRPAFYNYVIVMFAITAVMLFACGLAGIRVGVGLWLYNLAVVCYHSLYLPFLYVTFLADFFKEEDWLLDCAYYSEMRDAGFFDADWERPEKDALFKAYSSLAEGLQRTNHQASSFTCKEQTEPLKDSVPEFHRLAKSTDASIREVTKQHGWNFIFTRGLNDWEMERLTSFLQILEGVREFNDNEDVIVWKDKGKKVFTVKGAYAFFSNEGHHSSWTWKQI